MEGRGRRGQRKKLGSSGPVKTPADLSQELYSWDGCAELLPVEVRKLDLPPFP